MWVWVLGQCRGVPPTQSELSGRSLPFCSTEPTVCCARGTDKHQLSGAFHSRLSDGLYFWARPSLHLTLWNPESLMCSDPSCHCSTFSTMLSVYPKSRGEKETFGAGNIEMEVMSFVIGICKDFYQVTQMVSICRESLGYFRSNSGQ